MERELVRNRLECWPQGSWSSPKWYPLRGAGQARQEHRNCPISHNFKLSNVAFQSTTWGRWEPRADRRQEMANRPRLGRGRPGEHIDHQGVGSNQEGKSTKGGGPINARGRPFDHSGEEDRGPTLSRPLPWEMGRPIPEHVYSKSDMFLEWLSFTLAEKGSDFFARVRGQS